jgi:putative transposase
LKELTSTDFFPRPSKKFSCDGQWVVSGLSITNANFWGKCAKYPRFKAKHNGGSAEFTKSAFKYCDGNLWLAKCTEPLNIIWSRLLPDGTSPSTVTVKLKSSGRWFVSLLIDDPTVQPLPPTDKKVGIDVGISSLLATSDGNKITNPKHFNRLYQKLKVAQKELSGQVHLN